MSKKEEKKIVLDLGIEGGTKTLEIDLESMPENTDYYELAGRIAYDLSLWHEIGTWFGTSTIPMIPERFSSFSPEDLYSNLLGVRIGVLALKSDLAYEEAMTELLASTLVSLAAVNDEEETLAAMEKVQELWWTRKKAIPNKRLLLKRYLQNGTSLVPWLVPDREESHVAYKLKIPDNDFRNYYYLKIRLNGKFPVSSIFPFKSDRIISQKDFDELILFIEKQNIRFDEKYANNKNSGKRI